MKIIGILVEEEKPKNQVVFEVRDYVTDDMYVVIKRTPDYEQAWDTWARLKAAGLETVSVVETIKRL
jgi:hypothetical protein